MEHQIDLAAARHFLALIGKNGDARFRAFAHKSAPPERKKSSARKFGRDKDALLQAHEAGLDIYVVINSGGDTKSSITHCVGYFAEFDGMEEAEQHDILFKQDLMPEPSVVVRTGGSSLHAYWLLSEPLTDTAQWQADMKRLAAHLGSDPSINDPSRVMRLPGCWYMDGEGKPVAQVEIIHESAARYTRDDIVRRLPEPEPSTTTPAADAVREPSSDRTASRALDLLRRIPSRTPGSNTRPQYLKLLWALAHILGPERAGAAMAMHSTEWAAEEDLVDKAKEANGEVHDGSFFELAREVWGIEGYGTDWIKEQLQECLAESLSPGQMAVEVARIAAEAEVHGAAVEKILAGLTADQTEAEAAEDITAVISQADAAAAQVETIRLEQYLPADITGALHTFKQGIPYQDLTLLFAQLVMASSCLKLGTRINGNPFTDWEVPLNLYGIDVGPSGAKKSPLVKAIFTKPSEEIRDQLSRVNTDRFEAWEEECKTKKQNKPLRPTALLHTTNDYTAEALSDQLAAHEGNGMALLVLRDEVAALFDSFGKYRQGGKGTGGDEQQLLEIFDGEGFNSIRCSKGRTYNRCHVSLYGGIQDDVLRRLIASGDANGKWARCIFVPLPEMTYQLPTVTPEGRQQRRDAERTLKSIATALWQEAPRTYELDDEGINLLSQYDHLCQQERNEATLNAVKALKNKSPGKALRIAGLLHILHCQQNGQFLIDVPVARLSEAILLVNTLDNWTAAFHATAQLEKHAADAINDRQRILRRIHEVAGRSKGPVSWKVIRQGLKGAEKKGITAALAKVMLQQLHDMAIGQLGEGKRGGITYQALAPFPD
ncbi:DUF3987 domain-containing protein [Synechococcus sp. RS9902]|uniref:DUF3987 domain-containing protein n=1 Tax=Synechococcus sp. RS9902 TaxID=221345 RepID=UPI001644FA7B|nr:DUF3987 domain-containing protein [Synechococcus sp. RS9902]QNI98416.1 hypothetical protein SynRS9902_02545 [Synechococcus sp. RS9902]